MATLLDKALVLRRTPFGESSLVVQALTRNHGRVHFMAKGAYRQTSSYYCVLDFFDELELEWSSRNNRELVTLRKGRVERLRRGVSEATGRYRVALQILELCELAAQPAQINTELFDLASKALDALQEGSWEPSWVLVVFELRFLQNLGLAPSLKHCASCAREAPVLEERAPAKAPRIAFSAGAGGRLCLDCAREARASGRRAGTLSLELIENAAALRDKGLSAARALTPEALADAGRFTERFMDYHLETRPRSRRSGLSTSPATKLAR